MKSVIFEDIAALRKIKKAKRKKMLSLMSTYPGWHKTDSPVAREIRRLGKDLGGETMDVSKPIKSININKFTATEYVFLRKLGYKDSTLKKAAGLDRYEWRDFKQFLVEGQSKENRHVRNLPHNDHGASC